MNNKKFSIIIPCYNSENTIEETLNSIVGQEFIDETEVIICDDRSTDNFMDKVNLFNDKLCIKYFRTNDDDPKGPSNARNLGIKNSNGEWIIFLDSDDKLSINALTILNDHILNGEKNFIWCPFRHNYDRVFFESKLALQGKCFNRDFLIRNKIFFDTDLYTEEDYNFITKVVFELYANNIEYTHDIENFICEHLDNENSMVHTIENYWISTYKYFAYSYTRPSIEYFRKYPHLKDYFLRDTMFNFIMAYYRLMYFRDNGVENIDYYKNILNNVYKEILITYNIGFNDILKFINDEELHSNARIVARIDMGIENVTVITEETFINDFNDVSINPTFSVVIPCFNCKKNIRIPLDSIVKQNFKDFEVIICDDRSTDNFYDIVKEYNDKLFIRYYRTEEGTKHCPSNPRQLGLDNAKGKWVIFIDSDDSFSDAAFEDYNTCINEGAKNMIWGGFSKPNAIFYESRIALHGKAFNVDFLRINDIRFNTNIFMEEDYEFIQRVLYTIEGTDDVYYRWNKNFYNYTVDSSTSSMSSVGEKYFENTYESFLQSRFNPLVDSYIRFGDDKKEYFKNLLIYTIFLCYYKYLYFIERNDKEFMDTYIEKTYRQIYRVCGLLRINYEDLLWYKKNKGYLNEHARIEIMCDMDVNDFKNNTTFKEYIKNIIKI